jgi:SAM-dependent methyltransferase
MEIQIIQDKTRITTGAFDRSAKAYENRFMDVSPYGESIGLFMKHLGDRDRILDLGCGPGNMAAHLLRSLASLEIFGVDLSTEMICLARKNVPAALYAVSDIRALPFAKKSFDGIIASFCLPFLYDQEASALIEGMAHCLKDRGHIYLSTMMGRGYGYETTGFSGDEKIFFNYYSRNFLEGEFHLKGLDIISCREQDYRNPDGTILKDMIFILKKNGLPG